MPFLGHRFPLLMLSCLLEQKSRAALRLSEIKAASLYVRLVKYLRFGMLGVLALLLCLVLVLSGFVILHLALALYLPWPLHDRGILLVALGLLYIVIAAVWLLVASSQRTWMRCTGAGRLVRNVTE